MKILDIPSSLTRAVELIIFTLGTLLIIAVIVRFTSSRVFRAFEDEVEIEQRILLSKIYSFFWYVVGFGAVLWKAGVSTTNITLFLGLATTGVAFAIRDVLMAIFAWLIVLGKKPFKIKDYVKIGDDSGEVSRIGTFYITLQERKQSQNIVKVPNKTLLEKSIANYGKQRKLFSVKVPLNEIPPDISKRITELKVILQKYTVENEEVKIKIESEGVNWHLLISLIGKSSKDDLYNKMVIKSCALFDDVVKKNKKENIGV